MSLLATASQWEQNDPPNTSTSTKKRVSSIGKPETPLRMPPLDETTHTQFEGMEEYNARTTQRVSHLLNKMSNVDAFNDGDGLVNYKPRPATIASQSSIHPAQVDAMTTMSDRVADVIPPPLPQPVQHRTLPQPDYMPNNGYVRDGYANYHTVHTPKPAHPRANAGNRPNMLDGNDRIMEKLNYLIHLMEEQQMEKTNNVMEEFILYSLLGIFMIYTVDAFTRAGKYSR